MKRAAFAMLALLTFAPPLLILHEEALAQPGAVADLRSGWSEEQRQVWSIIEAWNDAFEANDADRYFAFVDPAITVLTGSNPYRIEGLSADRREFEFGVDRGYSRVALFQEIQPHIVVGSQMALVTYYSRGWYGPEENGRMVYFKETDVLVRRDGEWKIIHVHVSPTS